MAQLTSLFFKGIWWCYKNTPLLFGLKSGVIRQAEDLSCLTSPFHIAEMMCKLLARLVQRNQQHVGLLVWQPPKTFQYYYD